MGTKKIGRPTDNPKDIMFKTRLDKDTSDKLDECSEKMKVPKAEVVRRGVHLIHDGLEKK